MEQWARLRRLFPYGPEKLISDGLMPDITIADSKLANLPGYLGSLAITLISKSKPSSQFTPTAVQLG